jgi:prephenate dehydrogenase
LAEESLAGRTVVIAGLGMLGGSLGLALRRLPAPPRVLGWARRAETVREAVAAGMIDAGSTDAATILPQADLTVICLPVRTMVDFAGAHAAQWRRGSAVTDVGSTKRELAAAITPLLASHGVHFVGSHPMAGSEQSGLQHANPDLYRNACVFITPEAGTDRDAARLVEALWRHLGARITVIAPDRHDALVARTSHALHLVAAAAVDAVLRDDQAVLGTAGGFRDVTRIAASSPQMWLEIFQSNRDEVLHALAEFRGELDAAQGLLERRDWAGLEQHLGQTRERRQRWFDQWQKLKGSGPT